MNKIIVDGRRRDEDPPDELKACQKHDAITYAAHVPIRRLIPSMHIITQQLTIVPLLMMPHPPSSTLPSARRDPQLSAPRGCRRS
ncbi:hypothetical protein EVAR_92757_1 [Eumeta japonica]|uniref:Uncharacterized protein n=1 Tax=Eumeta variegata TaxID=151549 RepID=A0A4C1SZZ9_EUMVA|nr:hypothetical protein EVAR_92757_1 [Eumeta japonica]